MSDKKGCVSHSGCWFIQRFLTFYLQQFLISVALIYALGTNKALIHINLLICLVKSAMKQNSIVLYAYIGVVLLLVLDDFVHTAANRLTRVRKET